MEPEIGPENNVTQAKIYLRIFSYRSILLLPILLKMLEKIFLVRVKEVESNN